MRDQTPLPYFDSGEWKCAQCGKVERWSWAATTPISTEAKAALIRACALIHTCKGAERVPH